MFTNRHLTQQYFQTSKCCLCGPTLAIKRILKSPGPPPIRPAGAWCRAPDDDDDDDDDDDRWQTYGDRWQMTMMTLTTMMIDGKPMANPLQTHGKPLANPRPTIGEPMANR